MEKKKCSDSCNPHEVESSHADYLSKLHNYPRQDRDSKRYGFLRMGFMDENSISCQRKVLGNQLRLLKQDD